MQLFYPKIAALGYPANVVTNGHAGVLWVFDISEKNQMSVMRALKTHEADIEEHWIDVGWWASGALSAVLLAVAVRCHGCCMLSLCPLPLTYQTLTRQTVSVCAGQQLVMLTFC